jgi:hypothetical protein
LVAEVPTAAASLPPKQTSPSLSEKLKLLTTNSFGTSSSKLLYEICQVDNQPTLSLIDCGAGGIFYSQEAAKRNKTIIYPNGTPVLVEVADGRPLELTHHAIIQLKFPINNSKDIISVTQRVEVAPIKHADLILGMPFLKTVNPHIDWRAGILHVPKDTATEGFAIVPNTKSKSIPIATLIPSHHFLINYLNKSIHYLEE